ncbi:MAG: bifunctional phosphoribosylaminoimidazolecarboxamide formyltransferase/IMP cyclohydrolase [Elusimicrobiota bacterium]
MKALISVYKKEKIIEFARRLSKMDWDIVSTGGTYKYLEKAGINVTKVSDITGTQEMLGGRVKTLHTKIFAGILAREDQQSEIENLDIPGFEIVCCNLYPFKKAVKKYNNEEEILENIDIGGVTLLRAGAKNYKRVTVVTEPDDYDLIIKDLKSGSVSLKRKRGLALKAFQKTADYDIAISNYFKGAEIKDQLYIRERKSMDLRYGENPHQKGALYGDIPYKKLQGEKELSFNNIQDMDAAVNVVRDLKIPGTAIIKHMVPCGAASGADVHEAYCKALESDPMSAFGGIVSFNTKVDKKTALEMVKHFFEVIAAPEFEPEALKVLSSKKNLRVVKYSKNGNDFDIRKINGGFLVQEQDSFEGEKWEAVTEKKPSDEQLSELEFAWRIAGNLRSNAIVISKDMQTKGLGSGETARVKAVEVAGSKIKQFFGENQDDLVMASDGFFPFPDAVERAAELNVSAIIQPGGSKNDSKVIDKCNELGIAMVFAGRRHFLH